MGSAGRNEGELSVIAVWNVAPRMGSAGRNANFLLGEDGYMKENSLIKQEQDMFYVNKNGAMVTNDIKTIDGKVVYFGADGKAVREGVIQFENETYNIKEYNATKINKE